MGGGFVNKLTVDRDEGYSRERRTVHVLRYTGNQLAKRNIRKFMEVIYKNFESAADTVALNHTRREIARLLTSFKTIDAHFISFYISSLQE